MAIYVYFHNIVGINDDLQNIHLWKDGIESFAGFLHNSSDRFDILYLSGKCTRLCDKNIIHLYDCFHKYFIITLGIKKIRNRLFKNTGSGKEGSKFKMEYIYPKSTTYDQCK